MLTLLLADDERLLREGVAELIDWAGLGIDRLLQAENGKEALELAREHAPDILLTDVKMPLMDGIALARAFHREFPETRIIFLSGYADVEYLKAAIQEQAVDYILKPVDPRELESAIGKAARAVNGQREHREQQLTMRRLIQKSLPAYRKDFFSRLFTTDWDVEALQEQFSFCDFPFQEDDGFLVAMVSLRYEKMVSGTQIAFLGGEAEELLRQCLTEEGLVGYVYPASHDLYALILLASEQEEPETELYGRLLGSLTAQLPAECSIGVGTLCSGIYNIRESRECAELALSRQFQGGRGRIYRYQENPVTELPSLTIDRNHVELLCSCILSGDRAACMELLPVLTRKLEQLEYVDWAYLSCYCLHALSIVLFRLCAEKGRGEGAPIELLVQCHTALSACRTVTELEKLFSSILEDLLQMFSRESQTQNRRIVREVLAYLDDHYSEAVTIQKIARELYVTPAYLCRLFKKETSQTINEALTELRIRKAKELLEARRYRLYEIAPMVGYQDIKYFSRIFKAHTGSTPGEYGERAGASGERNSI